MELKNFPNYYKHYSWNAKHKLFGYPHDKYPDFEWIMSLEKRFHWLSKNSHIENTATKYLIQEMIEWGGSQNGVLQKFNDKSGEVNLYDLVQKVINNIDDPKKAISEALNIPGLGLTYASKLLRFMKPEKYGALDNRLREALLENKFLPKIYDGNNMSMINGYLKYLDLLKDWASKLENDDIKKPQCKLSEGDSWYASQIEMALFCWAEKKSLNNLSNDKFNESNKELEQSRGSFTQKKPSKMDSAKQVFQKMAAANHSRKEIIEAFIKDVGLTTKGAATYYQTLKTATNEPV